MFDKDVNKFIKNSIKLLKWYVSVRILFGTAIWLTILFMVYKYIVSPHKEIENANSSFPASKIEQQVILDKFIKVRNMEDAFDKGLGGIFVPDDKKLKYSYVGSHQIKDSLGRVQTPQNCFDGVSNYKINNISEKIGNKIYFNDMTTEEIKDWKVNIEPEYITSIKFFNYNIFNGYAGSYYCPDMLTQNIYKEDNEKIFFGSYRYPKSKLETEFFKMDRLKNEYSIFDTTYNNERDKKFIYYHNKTGTIVDTTNNGVNIYSKDYIDEIFNYAVEYWGSPAEASSYKNTINYNESNFLSKEEKAKAKYFYEKWIFERNGIFKK